MKLIWHCIENDLRWCSGSHNICCRLGMTFGHLEFNRELPKYEHVKIWVCQFFYQNVGNFKKWTNFLFRQTITKFVLAYPHLICQFLLFFLIGTNLILTAFYPVRGRFAGKDGSPATDSGIFCGLLPARLQLLQTPTSCGHPGRRPSTRLGKNCHQVEIIIVYFLRNQYSLSSKKQKLSFLEESNSFEFDQIYIKNY